jgi:lipoprotein-anchoring transpeptidase ErfK/SrfK
MLVDATDPFTASPGDRRRPRPKWPLMAFFGAAFGAVALLALLAATRGDAPGGPGLGDILAGLLGQAPPAQDETDAAGPDATPPAASPQPFAGRLHRDPGAVHPADPPPRPAGMPPGANATAVAAGGPDSPAVDAVPPPALSGVLPGPVYERLAAAAGLAVERGEPGDAVGLLGFAAPAGPEPPADAPLDGAGGPGERPRPGAGDAMAGLELGPAAVLSPDPPANPGAGAGALRILIEKGAHRLTLFRDGRPARRWPVGLGKDDSTPEGTFYIALKLVDPDWYNRGEVVPADDPDNPLGEHWMSLGAGGARTPYGIHGTIEPGSIGRSLSRGCVRMFPGDVAALFRMCPVGTRVDIVSGVARK